MNYLAIDTTGKHLKLLLVFKGKEYFVFEGGENSHSVTLIPEIDKLFLSAGCGLKDMDCIGTVVGPGSFTGTRIGVAAVKGLCGPLGIPVVPVNFFQINAERKTQNADCEEKIIYKACFDSEIKDGGMIPSAELYPLYLQNSYAEGKFKFDFDIAGLKIAGQFRVTVKDNGRITAHYSFTEAPDFFEILEFEVRREYRRIGLGKLMLQDIKERAVRAGKEKIFLEVRTGNERAIKLYEKAGFRVYATRKAYYPNGEDAHNMVYDLQGDML